MTLSNAISRNKITLWTCPLFTEVPPTSCSILSALHSPSPCPFITLPLSLLSFEAQVRSNYSTDFLNNSLTLPSSAAVWRSSSQKVLVLSLASFVPVKQVSIVHHRRLLRLVARFCDFWVLNDITINYFFVQTWLDLIVIYILLFVYCLCIWNVNRSLRLDYALDSTAHITILPKLIVGFSVFNFVFHSWIAHDSYDS